MRQADSDKSYLSRYHGGSQDSCNHFHHTGADGKNRKSHSLNRETHRIDQRQQTVATGTEQKKLIRVRNDRRLTRIHKEQSQLLSKKHRDCKTDGGH